MKDTLILILPIEETAVSLFGVLSKISRNEFSISGVPFAGSHVEITCTLKAAMKILSALPTDEAQTGQQ